MLLELARLHDVDLPASTHVGDSDRDRGAAANADTATFVRTQDFFGWPISTDQNRHVDARPATGLALDPKLAAVRHHDVPDDREPEAGAAELARTRLVDTVEPLGDPREIGRRDPDAGVDHGDLELAAGYRSRRHRHAAALRRVLDRVVDQVDDDLYEPV